MRGLRGAVVLVGSILLTGAAEPAPEDWRVERHEASWEVPPGAEIRVENPSGDIAVRTHSKPELYLLVNWQHHREDPRRLEVVAEPSATQVSVRVDFPAGGMEAVPESWGKRRADVTVLVPEEAATQFRTGSGTLEVRGTRAPTRVETATGNVRLRIAGSATVRTEHGSVLAQFVRTDWQQPVEISTVSGAIRVEMPHGGRAAVTLETRGEITSDYSMDLERVEGTQLKRVRLTAGQEGSEVGTVDLRSYSGSIQIVETLVAQEKGGEQ